MCTEVNHAVITVSAIPGHGPDEEQEISYKDVKVIGKGTFGVVYRAQLCETAQMVAIKKVFHNEKFKVRCNKVLTFNHLAQIHFFYKFSFLNFLLQLNNFIAVCSLL